MDTSGLLVFVGFRCILFLDTSESDVLGASRCIRNVWFLEHTSEMPDLGAVRCIVTLVSVGDTSGLRIRCPSRCTWVQILIKYTSGWTNIGHFRCIAKDRHTKIHRNSSNDSHPDVSPNIAIPKYIGIHSFLSIPMYPNLFPAMLSTSPRSLLPRESTSL